MTIKNATWSPVRRWCRTVVQWVAAWVIVFAGTAPTLLFSPAAQASTCIGDGTGTAECRPPEISTFLYALLPGGQYPANCQSLLGPFPSEQQARDSALAFFQCAAPNVCSTTYAGEADWTAYWHFPAYPDEYRKNINYSTTAYNNIAPFCGQQGQAGITLRKFRQVKCSQGYQPDASYTNCTKEPIPDPCNCNLLGSKGNPEAGTNLRGNPINILDGAKKEADTDIAGFGSNQLRVQRFYNSYGFAPRHAAQPTGLIGSLGHYWRLSLDRSVATGLFGSNQVAYVDRPDGTVRTFVLSNGTWTSQYDKSNRLVMLTDGSGNLQGWRYYALDSGELEVFDSNGLLLQIWQIAGTHQGLTYSTSATPPTVAPRPGLLLSVVDDFGRTLQMKLDAMGRVSSITDPAGGSIGYGFDDFTSSTNLFPTQNLLSVTYQDGTSKQYVYNESANTSSQNYPSAVTGVLDENGARYATFGYNWYAQAVRTEHAGGVDKYVMNYSSYTLVTDPLGPASYIYMTNVLGVLKNAGMTQPAGNGAASATSRTAFDADGNLISRNDFDGVRTCYTYDLTRDLELSRVEGLASAAVCSAYTPANAALPTGSRKVSTVWHPDWRLPVQVAEPGQLTTTVYNGQPDPFNGNAIASCAPSTALLPDGKPIVVVCKKVEQATTDTDGHLGFTAALQSGVPNQVWTYTYNQYGQKLTETDPLGNTASYAYYADTTTDHTMGDLQSVTDAAGLTTQYARYNPHGQVLRVADANGVITDSVYDARQRLTSTTTAGKVTTYAYWPTGLLKQLTTPTGNWIAYRYDDAHRLVGISDNAGNSIAYTLDNAGNRTKEDVTDPAGTLRQTLSRAMDGMGIVQQTSGRE